MRKINLKLILIILLAVLLLGCSDAPTSTLEPVTWEAPPVVAMLYVSAPGNAYEYYWNRLPQVVLYADGTAIFSEYDAALNKVALYQSEIDPAQRCELLHQIEASGFLGYDQSTYDQKSNELAITITDGETSYLAVNMWQANTVAAYMLGIDIDPTDDVPPLGEGGLIETAALLESFPSTNAIPYEVDKVVVRLEKDSLEREAPRWGFDAVPIEQLTADMRDGNHEVVLAGEDAKAIWAYYAGGDFRQYSDGESTYAIGVRPMLPYEVHRMRSWSEPPVFDDTPRFELTCDPAEG